MEGVLLETAKGLDTTWSLCFCKSKRNKKVSRPGFAVVPKDSLEISTTDWLESRVNESVPANWRTPNHEDWGPDWPIGGHQNHANASSFARCPKCQDVHSRPKWVVPLDSWWIEKGPVSHLESVFLSTCAR